MLEPDHGGSGSVGTARTASSTPGMNDSRSSESWRIVRVSPCAAEDDLLVRDEAGQADRVDRHLAADRRPHQRRGARRGAARRVELAVVMQLDDLGLRRSAAAASAAKRIISTAPMAKFGAMKTLPAARAAAARSGSGSKPVVPMTTWTPAARHSSALACAVAGCVKSTTTSALAQARRRASCRAPGRRGR